MEIIWVNIAHMKDKEGNSKVIGLDVPCHRGYSVWMISCVCHRLYILFILIKTWF